MRDRVVVGAVHRVAESARAYRFFGRRIPSVAIRPRSVDSGIPSAFAAPFGPAMTQSVSSNTCSR